MQLFQSIGSKPHLLLAHRHRDQLYADYQRVTTAEIRHTIGSHMTLKPP